MNPSGKRTVDAVELLQFVVTETQKFHTDLSAKINAAIESGQVPATSVGFMHQLTQALPQYIAFAPQPPQHIPQPMPNAQQPLPPVQNMAVQPSVMQPMPMPMQSSSLPPVQLGTNQPGKKVKRKLSAFNVYMQKKCEQLKAAGIGQGGLAAERFQMAAVSWKNLTQEQRQGYIQLFHANEEDPALDILPEPLPGVNNESRAERKRREKLMAAQKKEEETDVTDFLGQLQQEKQAEEGGEERTESDDKDPRKKHVAKKARKS